MSKPFTYWVRLAMVVTMCTLVTFSPVNAGRLMDRLLHRDACKTSATDCCEPKIPCEPSFLVVPCDQCPSEPAPQCAVTMSCAPAQTGCDAIPASPCGCETGMNVPSTLMHQVPLEPALNAMPSPVPHEAHPAPVVNAPKTAPPIAKAPDPVVSKPAPVVEKPAPVVEKPAPVVEKPAPVVEKPAPVAEEPAPVAEEPAPVVAKPAPMAVEPVPDIQEPKKPADDIFGEAPAAKEPSSDPFGTAPAEKQPAADPFGAAPTEKQPAADPFGEPPATKQPAEDLFGDAPADKQPPADPFGEAPAVQKPADDIFGDPAAPAVERSAVEPEMPASPPAKTEIDDLFSTNPAPSAAVESSPPKIDDVFGADPKAVEPAVEAKPADTSIDDLFNTNEKPAAPAAGTSIDDLFGKPIATEFDSASGIANEEPVKDEAANKAPAQEEASIDSLFGMPSDPAVNVSELAEPEKDIEKPLSLPADENEPAKAKEQIDELDALFGVGAFAPPSEFKGAEFRQWIDNSGAYQVNARLAVIYVDKVKLLKENGKFTTVPLSRLSDADFGYVSWVASNLTTEQTARMVKTESQTIESDVSR